MDFGVGTILLITFRFVGSQSHSPQVLHDAGTVGGGHLLPPNLGTVVICPLLTLGIVEHNAKCKALSIFKAAKLDYK